MRYPQVLVYETDGRIAAQLRGLAEARQWSLRQPRRPDECLRLAAQGGPCVLVLKLSTDRAAELTLLDRVTWLCPETATVVVADTETASFVGLAWDLGASFVLGPRQDRAILNELVVGLMGTAEADDDSRAASP